MGSSLSVFDASPLFSSIVRDRISRNARGSDISGAPSTRRCCCCGDNDDNEEEENDLQLVVANSAMHRSECERSESVRRALGSTHAADLIVDSDSCSWHEVFLMFLVFLWASGSEIVLWMRNSSNSALPSACTADRQAGLLPLSETPNLGRKTCCC